MCVPLTTPSTIERFVECLAADVALPHVVLWFDGARSAFTLCNLPRFVFPLALRERTSLSMQLARNAHNPSTLVFYRSARFADEVQTLLHLSIPNTYYDPTVCLLLYGVLRTLCNYRACVACPTVRGSSTSCALRFHICHTTVVE